MDGCMYVCMYVGKREGGEEIVWKERGEIKT